MSVLEIVFAGQCEVFVYLDFVEISFSPLGREAHRSANRGVSSLKNVDFSNTHPLKEIISWSELYMVSTFARYIAGKRNILVDQVLPTEESILLRVFDDIC